MRNRMLGTWAVLIACGLLAFAGTAQAASINSVVDTDHDSFGGTFPGNSFSDDSYEVILNNFGSATTLDAGDVLRGIIKIKTLKRSDPLLDDLNVGAANPPSGPTVNEVTALFQTKVLAKIDLGGGNYTFLFGPDPGFTEAGSYAAASDGAGGVMALFYEDSTPDFTSSGGNGSIDVTNATNGTFFGALGMNGNLFGANGVWEGFDSSGALDDDTLITTLGESWVATPSRDSIAPGLTSSYIGSANYALNRILGAGGTLTGWTMESLFGFDTGTSGEFVGTADFNINTPGAAWSVIDNAEFSFNVTSIVPVPAAAWMGFALLGALGLGRRLRRRK